MGLKKKESKSTVEKKLFFLKNSLNKSSKPHVKKKGMGEGKKKKDTNEYQDKGLPCISSWNCRE